MKGGEGESGLCILQGQACGCVARHRGHWCAVPVPLVCGASSFAYRQCIPSVEPSHYIPTRVTNATSCRELHVCLFLAGPGETQLLIPPFLVQSLLSALGSDLSPHEVITLCRQLGADRQVRVRWCVCVCGPVWVWVCGPVRVRAGVGAGRCGTIRSCLTMQDMPAAP